MSLSKFDGKEIVNLNDGSMLGLIEDTDLLVVDETSGKINSFIVIKNRLLFRKRQKRIPGSNIKKIGNDMVIMEKMINKNIDLQVI